MLKLGFEGFPNPVNANDGQLTKNAKFTIET